MPSGSVTSDASRVAGAGRAARRRVGMHHEPTIGRAVRDEGRIGRDPDRVGPQARAAPDRAAVVAHGPADRRALAGEVLRRRADRDVTRRSAGGVAIDVGDGADGCWSSIGLRHGPATAGVGDDRDVLAVGRRREVEGLRHGVRRRASRASPPARRCRGSRPRRPGACSPACVDSSTRVDPVRPASPSPMLATVQVTLNGASHRSGRAGR